MHSLGLAYHRDKVVGEIYFVVIGHQGVLCLEVKGGHVAREQGVWYFTDRYGNQGKRNEGPFEQIYGAMLALRQHLGEQFGFQDPIVRCQYSCGVVFTDMPFNQKGPEVIPEIVFDTRRPLDGIETYIKDVFKYWRNRLEDAHGFQGGTLSKQQIARLVQYLRGDFGFVPSLGHTVISTKQQLLALTREQADRLAIASENPHILLRGGAGTGKTLLSLEHSQRMAALGKRILFLCYNKNLATILREKCEELDSNIKENIIISHFHEFIDEYLQANHVAPVRDNCTKIEQFFQVDLPENFCNFCELQGFVNPYDVLVVDEGQDLLRYEYIMCWDKILKGGLKEGKWHICYDPNQNIYNPSLLEGLELLKDYNPTVLTLDTNCRNTKPIGITTTDFTGIQPEKYLHINGEEVVKISYRDKTDQRRQVIRTVKNLLGQGIDPSSIYLLSRYKLKGSCLKDEYAFKGIVAFQDISNYNPIAVINNSVRFSTIHSFKGLEAPVVLLLDVEEIDSDLARQLNYTGMTRANSLLYVFYNEAIGDV